MPDDYNTEVSIQGEYSGAPKTVAVDQFGQLYSLMVGANGVVVAVDSTGKIQSVMQGVYGSTTKTLLCDADGRLLAQLMGMYGSTPVPIACDVGGRLTVAAFDQTNISPDSSEAQTLDTPLVSIVSNLNRIRHWIVALSGESWGTVSHSIADLWAKFHATTGHKHTGATSDAPVLSHAGLSGLSADDHPQYEQTSAITALFHATTGHKHTGVTGDAAQVDHGGLGGLGDDDHTQYYRVDGTRALTAGIPFPSVQVPSVGANTLDDYEEGAWTPGIAFNGGTTGITYSAVTAGFYTKVGNVVILTGLIVLTSKGSSIGAAVITGLPFIVASGTGNYSSCILQLNTVSFADQYNAYIESATSILLLMQITNAGVPSYITNANFANNSQIMISAVYRTA